jgi:hypothetical protein
MGLFDIFKKKLKQKMPDQEDRDLGGLVNARKWQLRRERLDLEHEIEMLKLKRQQAELEFELYGDEEEDTGSIDSMFMNILMKGLQQKGFIPADVPAPQSVDPQSPSVVHQTLTDQQFEEIWSKIPATQKPMIKMASNDQIKGWILTNYPSIDDETVNRAVLFVRKK